METERIFLLGLQNKVFKLLPMKEAFDAGVNNYIYKYLENVTDLAKSGLALYEKLGTSKRYLEIVANLTTLTEEDVDFQKWRAIVLRTTRLAHTLCLLYSDQKDRGGEQNGD